MSRWFRVYDDLVDDPKVQKLSSDNFKALVNLWCLASKNDGALPSVEDISFKLRKDLGKTVKLLKELIDCGLLDRDEKGLHPHNWEGRQYKSDVSTNRVKLFRERRKSVSGNGDETFHPPLLKRPETKNETPPDTETESDTERIDSCAVAVATRTDYSDAFEQLWKIYPKRDGANPKAPAAKKLTAILKSGVPMDVILSGARRYRAEMERKQQVGTAYVAQLVTWLNQQRWGDYQPTLPMNGHSMKLPPTEEELAIRKRMAEEGAKFFDEFGNLKPY